MASRAQEKRGKAGLASQRAGKKVWRLEWICLALLIFGPLLAYQSAWSAGYVWDDDNHLTANPCIVGPLGFKEIWTTKYADISPLTRSTFWLEHKIWGLSPIPYHVVNVLLHAACAVTLWRVLRLLAVPGAWLAAAIWDLHPVNVETVSWISEMKNTESGLFFLLSIFFFVRWLSHVETRRERRDLFLTILFCALAMASKTSTVVLPAVCGLIAWWRGELWRRRNLAVAVPTALLALAACALSLWTQQLALGGYHDAHWARSWPERIVTAGDAIWFYLGKLLWPYPLMAVYPRWHIDGSNPLSYLPLLITLGVLFLFYLKRNGPGRPWFFAFAYFIGVLVPVIGLADQTIFRFSFVYNHFQYLPSMGPIALIASGLTLGAERIPVMQDVWPRAAIVSILLFVLGMLSWQRSWVYADDETLWLETVAQNPGCWVGNYNLGNDFSHDGRADDALLQYQKALALYPDFPEGRNNLANLLLNQGRTAEAIDQLNQALKIYPGYAEGHYNLGNALVKTGRTDDGIKQYKTALDLDPEFAAARDRLGDTLAQVGRLAEAEAQFAILLEKNPRDVQGHFDLGNIYFTRQRFDDAIVQYRAALEVDPDYASAHNNLGLALGARGDVPGAITEFEEALRLQPDYGDAQANLNQARTAEAKLSH